MSPSRPSGQARGLKPYWPSQLGNVAPRLAFAYSPDNKTSIRGGFGLYYDHFGQGIVNSFDQLGSFGTSTNLNNRGGQFFTGQCSPLHRRAQSAASREPPAQRRAIPIHSAYRRE